MELWFHPCSILDPACPFRAALKNTSNIRIDLIQRPHVFWFRYWPPLSWHLMHFRIYSLLELKANYLVLFSLEPPPLVWLSSSIPSVEFHLAPNCNSGFASGLTISVLRPKHILMSCPSQFHECNMKLRFTGMKFMRTWPNRERRKYFFFFLMQRGQVIFK